MNAEVAVIKTAAETALAQAFAQARDRLPGDEAIMARRNAAFDLFAKQGLPHRRIEEWKYTDLRALMRDAKPLASAPDASAKAHAKDAGRVEDVPGEAGIAAARSRLAVAAEAQLRVIGNPPRFIGHSDAYAMTADLVAYQRDDRV